MNTVIRTATPRDNEALLALTRLAPMSGRIAIRIDRDPDFFALVQHRGRGAVFVAERAGELTACMSVSIQDVYIGGAVRTGAYVADLKVHPRHLGTRSVVRMIEAAREYALANGAEVAWCVVARGNERVSPLLAGRLGIAPFAFAGTFVVEELLSIRRATSTPFEIGDAVPRDREAITALLDEFHRSRQLAPVASNGSHALATLVARQGGDVVATLELFDPTPIKRNVLLGAPLLTRIGLAALRPVARMPRVGEAVRMAYIRRFACAPGRIDALAALVRHARSIARKKGFTFAAIGLHERDPLRRLVSGAPRFSFSSLAYVASLRDSALTDVVRSGIPYEDFALV